MYILNILYFAPEASGAIILLVFNIKSKTK